MTPTQEIALAAGLGAALALAVLALLRRRARRIAESIAYLRGVRYVLSDAPEAAIGELTRAVELSPQISGASIETYFALGKLYRRKGDFEQAIRLHRNMLLRPGLAPAVKQEAQLELAIDLQRAGLFTQAAEAYEKFLAENPAHAEALENLRKVHEAVRDFEAAAGVQLRALQAGLGGAEILAHLLAAAARAALPGDAAHAGKLVDGALRACPGSVDAGLARAEVLIAQGNQEGAREQLRGLLGKAPEHALRIEPLLAQLLGPAEVACLLEQAQDGGQVLEVARARARLRAGDRVQAAEALRRALQAEPGFTPARRDLSALLLGSPLEPGLEPAYQELLRALNRPELEVCCAVCRHATREPDWQCPQCHTWDAFPQAVRPVSP